MLQFCLEEHLQMCTGQCVFFSLKQFAELFSCVFWWSPSRHLPLGGISKSKCSRKQKSKRLLPRLPPRLLLEAVWPIFWGGLGFLSDPSPMFALPCHSVKNEVEFTQPLQKSRNLSWMMLNLIVGFVKIVTSISRPLPNKNNPRTLNKVELNYCFFIKAVTWIWKSCYMYF